MGISKTRSAGLKEAHVRLFSDDIELLKKLAAAHGFSWQIELRLLVRRALKGQQREMIILKEKS